MADNLLDALNDEQRAAVEQTEGYVRVHAGAGTGKTRTLTYRYAYLISEYGMSPRSVWCVTFTNKAASEMKQRLLALCQDVGNPFVTTFHGFCATFLREEYASIGLPKEFNILDVEDVKDILKSLYSALEINGRELSLKQAWAFIDSTKEAALYIDEFIGADSELLYKRSLESEDIKTRLFYRYLFAQRTSFSLDFDDLILLTLHILKTREDIRLKWQKRLEYILVDEFQDIDKDQYELVSILANLNHNLFIVGDPDQTIYSFRGARVEYFTDFINYHQSKNHQVSDLYLTYNYRSQEHILQAAYSVICHNQDTKRLPLIAMRQDITLDHMVLISDPNLALLQQSVDIDKEAAHYIDQLANLNYGAKEDSPLFKSLEKQDLSSIFKDVHSLLPSVVHAKNITLEGEFVVEHIKKIIALDNNASIAILYRAHSVVNHLEKHLVSNNINYNIIGHIRFFDRKEIKDIVSYMRLRINLHDDVALRRIINIPNRGCGKKRMEHLENLAQQQHCSLFSALDKAYQEHDSYLFNSRTKLAQFVCEIKELNARKLTRLQDDFELILNKSGYEEWIKQSGDDVRLNNIADIKDYLQEFCRSQGEELNLADFIHTISLMRTMDNFSSKKAQVQLMTVHNAKGLEFDYVFVISLNEAIFPSQKAINEQSIEEERRLMYVAMTRAKKQLFLTEAGGSYLYRNPGNGGLLSSASYVSRLPSRFLSEISSDNFVEIGAVVKDNHLAPDKFSPNSSTLTHQAKFKVGDMIFHKIFGEGEIKAVNVIEGEYSVFFNKLGTNRTLSFSAKVELLTSNIHHDTKAISSPSNKNIIKIAQELVLNNILGVYADDDDES